MKIRFFKLYAGKLGVADSILIKEITSKTLFLSLSVGWGFFPSPSRSRVISLTLSLFLSLTVVNSEIQLLLFCVM